ncbi:tRNA G18 (ribose-2'-O)-methylase SpoU [Sanguibacter gelidistatuariae]|uniref:tRNA G18 (Ribose-2'-O)-methylase SpoU n=1 Tax=Sanguibacter gelidistatuariae TaxID=1814289 RepID=A0A1G6TM41_9MICO|nr:tRNA G18 (ribose-2'-O)-methylase SpoU [Sanguibacter gelidistatuariae]
MGSGGGGENGRVPLIAITDAADDRLADYINLTDIVLRSKSEPEKGLFIAESSTVIRRALAAGHRPRSFFMAQKWLDSMADVIADWPDVPVFVGEPAMLEAITGFHLHRGALAAMHRPPLVSVEELLAGARGGEGARRVAILEDVVDHTNVGAAFRSAAALGVDAVLVTPRCSDPLYRRSVRVSMGTVFQVPWTRIESWPAGIAELQAAGFTVASLALSDDSVTLDKFIEMKHEKTAFILGTEGHGLQPATLAASDYVVRIPMAGGVDSLNVAATAAVVFYATR